MVDEVQISMFYAFSCGNLQILEITNVKGSRKLISLPKDITKQPYKYPTNIDLYKKGNQIRVTHA